MPNRALQVERANRADHIVQLVIQGEPLAAVGQRYGITAQRVHQIWKRELAKRPVPRIDEHRARELATIEHASQALWSIVNDPDTHERNKVDALRVLSTWSEGRRRLLGLDAPTRKEITVLTEDVVDAALRQISAEHAAAALVLEAAGIEGAAT